MSTFFVHAAHFVLPGTLSGEGWLEVRDGRFGTFAQEPPAEGSQVVELGERTVGPGLVDTHIHGFFGHAADDCDPAGVNVSSVELARRGTTSWLPTTFTESTDAIEAACAAIAQADDSRDEGFVGARIQGIYLEGPFFTARHAGAQDPRYLIDPSVAELERWQAAAGGRIVKSALAPERAGSVEYVSTVTERGIKACIGHTDATFDEAMAAVNAGASVFVHTYNGMRGLHHRDPGVVGCAMATRQTYAELICDGMHVAPAAVRALVNAKGWDHVAIISDCLGCGGMPEGEYVSGGLPVVMRGGLCYLREGNNIAGSVATLAQLVRNMVDWGVVSAEQAIRMATEVPARAAGIEGACGLIKPGRPADFVAFDADMGLCRTYVGGVPVV